MSLGQLSSRGKQNNKLYQISVEISLNNDYVKFCFYSTQRINTFSKLRNFLSTCDNQTMRVFTDSYLYNQDKFYIITSIRYDSAVSSILIYYYVNDGQGWRIGNFSRSTIFISEV